MANPNLASFQGIKGESSVRRYVNVTPIKVVENPTDSSQVFKINSLYVSNNDPITPRNITVDFVRSNTSYSLAKTITIPPKCTLTVINRENALYLQESDSISAYTETDTLELLEVVCSFERLSENANIPFVNNSVDAITESYFTKYTVLKITANGTDGAQNNTFIDSSPNNFTITRNGNTTQGSFSPFSLSDGRWSNYFDGNGDYLSVPANTAFAFGTDNFTAECWFYIAGNSPAASNGNRGGMLFGTRGNGTSTQSNGFNFYVVGDANTTGTGLSSFIRSSNISYETEGVTPIPQHTWHHAAVVRSGTTVTIYLNGISIASNSNRGQNIENTQPLTIGYENFTGFTRDFNGYISNVRILKGTALYTSNFTPSTEPLISIANTSLLTCQSNRFLDNSSNNFAVTRNGGVSVEPINPFVDLDSYTPSANSGSAYFDGTGDFLTFPTDTAYAFGTGNFTVEYWINPTNLSIGLPVVVDLRGSSTVVGYHDFLNSSGQLNIFQEGTGTILTSSIGISINTWSHIAVVRNGTTLTVYVNGVSGGSVTNSTNWVAPSASGGRLGINISGSNPFSGYISNLRILKGTALYTSAFTPPTAPLTAITNTSLLLNFANAGIIDDSGKHVMETIGNVQLDTSITYAGSASIEFDGSGDYLRLPYSPELDLLAGSFTVEGWLRKPSSATERRIFSTGGGTVGWNSTTGIHVLVQATSSNQIELQMATGTASPYLLISTQTFSNDEWANWAVSYDKTLNIARVFVNGVMRQGSPTVQITRPSSNPLTTIGSIPNEGGSTFNFSGRMDNIIVSRHVKYAT